MNATPNEGSRVVGALIGTGSRTVKTVRVVCGLATVIIALIVIVGFVPGSADGGEPVVESVPVASPVPHEVITPDVEPDDDWQTRGDRIAEEERAKRQLFDVAAHSEHFAEMEKQSKARQRRTRKVRRFEWESPAETRGKLWNIPEGEGDEQTLTAFLRVCISEADGYAQDCVGIWQVIKNIRRSKCERGYVRRITECEEYTKRDGTSGLRETYLSVMKRASKSVLGIVPPRSKRSQWISELTLDCEQPPSWTRTENQWDSQYGSKRCARVVELGRYLIKNELPPRRPGVDLQWLPGRPITWGGRCENKRGACDDRIACARGLARIDQDMTHNAFWRRPSSPDEVDPVCVQLGYGQLVESDNDEQGAEVVAQEDVQTEPRPEESPIAVSEQELSDDDQS